MHIDMNLDNIFEITYELNEVRKSDLQQQQQANEQAVLTQRQMREQEMDSLLHCEPDVYADRLEQYVHQTIYTDRQDSYSTVLRGDYLTPFRPTRFDGSIFVAVLTLVLVVLASGRVDHTRRERQNALHLYLPIIASTLCISLMRALFLPDSYIVAFLFPVALVGLIWQLAIYYRLGRLCDRADSYFALVSMAVFAITAIGSAMGYVFISLLILYGWQTALNLLLAFLMIYRLLLQYKGKHDENSEKLGIGFQFAMHVLVPTLALLTIPFCLYMSLDLFNGSVTFFRLFFEPFYTKVEDGVVTATLSAYNVMWVFELFFVFRFLCPLVIDLYSRIRLDVARHRLGRSDFRTNEINLTLGKNLLSLLVWAIYLVIACYMLTIPLSSLAFIMTGLAAGIGFAMKDVINNIIYGAQLMSGRVRVGDVIECDGITGSVTDISYQSTQIRIWDGSVVHIANATLFDKNFKNFTRTTEYRRVSIPFGVAYGSDIERTRRVAAEAMEALMGGFDEFGRPVYRPGSVEINCLELAESGINFDARVDILHEKRWENLSLMRVAIYDALNREGIEIPFPQVDVHVKS